MLIMVKMEKTIYTPESARLGLWLRRQRQDKGLTMRDVGHLIEKPHSYIGKIEAGQRRLDVVELIWYCRQLGLDPHDAINAVEGDSSLELFTGKHGS